MEKVIAIGTQDFEKVRKNNYFLIDKTSLIKEWWDNGDAVTLITRPRRFGKTLNMSMLNCFFSNQYAKRRDLFEGLSIWEDERYREMQGTYPVIFLSFANIKGNTYEKIRNEIVQVLVKLYSKYAYVRDEHILNPKDLDYYDSVCSGMPDEVAVFSIHNLCDYLSRYYGKKVLVLLDEYDTPLQEAYVQGYWEEMAGFIRGLFNSTFKTNPYMERGLMTGITRVSKESIFSDLNNLTVITTTSEKYCTQFGFTENEVLSTLDQYGMSGQKEQVRQWYDGFTFGSQREVYNPWSITCFLEEKRLKPYWANTSSNSLAGKLIREGSPEVKTTMEDLLNGETLVTEIDEEIIFNQLGRKRNAIWSFLLASGYLRVENISWDEESGRYIYELKLTNREVRMMFTDMIRDWFASDDVPYNEFVKALLSGDVKAMNHYMNKVALATFSYFDTGKGSSEETEPERFYHGFVLGLLVELAGRYRITSNREIGFGRYDVVLDPLKSGDSAFVLEFKVHDPEDEATLADTVTSALKQIQDKAYDSNLIAGGVRREDIRHYGFAFEGKRVLIG